ncbi:L-serine dehydratase [Kineosphaera limosa]|uniref:L-serine dehydratase n=1 Tax=Kineosphaera limosa NBRC 100340 TaxID=1184609 RepID=K6VLT9_9MICO|nr:L-serine ammonia-lyase [Kineosphaera limosa]NYE02621.1 L-serine dehydratase [Kineosphaera limosa]GAB97183.1 L-serine dehydratase [Kineosphaera limosa NBRC 100340]
MSLSVLDLFSIGIGPSSSHTVGPMRAGRRFAIGLQRDGQLAEVARVSVGLFGSLGATGRGHGSDRAVLLGLEGADPETVDVEHAVGRVEAIRAAGELTLLGEHRIDFDAEADLVLHLRKSLPGHPNGMRFTAYDADGNTVREREYYSVGGGFVVDSRDVDRDSLPGDEVRLPAPFETAPELMEACRISGRSIAELMMANEDAFRPREETRAALLRIWAVMQECVETGCARTEPLLPGGLQVRRRAPALHRSLREHYEKAQRDGGSNDPLWAMEWVNLYALAVNEENATGGRVVTAPTNGAAGIVPAVLHFYTRFIDGADDDGVIDFLLTAGAIGIIFKQCASISGAEVGCQGEVGSACSMAAAGLCAVLGGTPQQIENAAEIGIEHNLGLTCDPVGGLVQVPCIERNAIASVKAINAARLAVLGDGSHRVTLDQAIRTMRETGADMKSKYKETSRGGLAVNVIEC